MENQINPEIHSSAHNFHPGLIAGAIVLLIAGAVVGYVVGKDKPTTVVQETVAPTYSPEITSGFYENEYLKVTIPAGWTATQASQTVSYGMCNDKEECTVTQKVEPNPAAVNIIKGNYILYINAHASQASGIEGGRISEIGMGAPSFDAVTINPSQPPCEPPVPGPLIEGLRRYDLYVSAANKKAECIKPTSGVVWYFSYMSRAGGYFNYYNNSGVGYVITMAYKASDVNAFPKKGTAELNARLAEMSSIVKTLELKRK